MAYRCFGYFNLKIKSKTTITSVLYKLKIQSNSSLSEIAIPNNGVDLSHIFLSL